MSNRFHRTLREYFVAFALLGVAIALRVALTPWLGSRFPFQTLYGVVALCVWFGSWPPAVIAALAGGLVVDHYFIHPAGSPDAFARLGAYALTCGFIIAFGEGMRAALRRSERSAALLRETQSELSRQVIDLSRLHELNSRLVQIPDFSDQLQAILASLVEVHGADQGLLALYDEQSRGLSILASTGIDPVALQALGVRPSNRSGKLAPGDFSGIREHGEDLP